MIREPMWEYMWGMTSAQLELIAIDKPLTLYGKKKTNNFRGTSFAVPDTEDIEKCRKRYEQEHKDDGGVINIKDITKNFTFKHKEK